MPKINIEEYKVLKSLDGRWKWIARDDENQINSGEVYIFEIKPEREDGYWNNTGNREYAFLRGRDASFQFIQWEDKEPHNIAELIEEYEDSKEYKDSLVIEYFLDKAKESEGTEVKKDVEWANGEIKKARDLLNNKRYEEEVDDFTTGVLSGLKKALDILNQLDESEVLSDKWIDDNSVYASSDGITEEYVHVDVLKEMLLSEQKLPVIPKFAADWIKENHGYNIYGALSAVDKEKHSQVHDWVFVKGGINDFTRAWLGGYTVEEEPLYRARLKVITDEFIASYLRTQSSDAEDRLKTLEIGSKYIHEDYRHLSEFTEDELKILDIWDSEHWEVEELEE